jgi:hypothetical protein
MYCACFVWYYQVFRIERGRGFGRFVETFPLRYKKLRIIAYWAMRRVYFQGKGTSSALQVVGFSSSCVFVTESCLVWCCFAAFEGNGLAATAKEVEDLLGEDDESDTDGYYEWAIFKEDWKAKNAASVTPAARELASPSISKTMVEQLIQEGIRLSKTTPKQAPKKRMRKAADVSESSSECYYVTFLNYCHVLS